MPLERVTDGLFDYAGMFPPAALSFEDALRESAQFNTSLRDFDLVGNDIVLTLDNLAKLNAESLHEAGFAGRTCRVCVVGVSIADAVHAAKQVKQFNQSHAKQSPSQQVTSLEIHFAEDDIASIQDAVSAARKALANTDVQLYLEPKWDDARLHAGMTAVFMILDSINESSPHVGFKVRCDGPNALSHATLAKAMAQVNLRSIPLKLTQGLHHAFAGDPRHGNAHGFLNCIFGLRLQRDTDMDVNELEVCLADDEPASFVWDQGIGWRNHRISMQSVVESSMSVPFAIGSCDIAEPDAELQELKD